MRRLRRGIPSFTLIELLVVVSIIGLLAGLAVPAVGGAMYAARKTKASAMAHQIRTALTQFNTEYGYFPTNGISGGIGQTGPALTLILVGSSSATNDNPRQIAFLEVPADFTLGNSGSVSNQGIVTPRGLYPKNAQTNFSVAVDHDYNGQVTVKDGSADKTIQATTAVWFTDGKDANKTVGTW